MVKIHPTSEAENKLHSYDNRWVAYSGLSFVDAVGEVLRKFARARGRASRSEFWYWRLAEFLTIVGWIVLASVITRASGAGSPVVFVDEYFRPAGWAGAGLVIVFLLLAIPEIAVTARRLHDVGLSAAFVLLLFIPFIGGPIISVLALFPSAGAANHFGPVPIPLKVSRSATDGFYLRDRAGRFDETSSQPSSAAKTGWWIAAAAVWLATPLMWWIFGSVMAMSLKNARNSSQEFNLLNDIWNNGDWVIAMLAGSTAVLAACLTSRGPYRLWAVGFAILGLASAVSWVLIAWRVGGYYAGLQFIGEPLLMAIDLGSLLAAWIFAVGVSKRVLFALLLTIPFGIISAIVAAAGYASLTYTWVGMATRPLLICTVLILALARKRRTRLPIAMTVAEHT